MRLYYSGASPDNLRKARQHAPSHSHGAMWTPEKMTESGLASETAYAIDNGAYTRSFDPEAWLDTIERSLLSSTYAVRYSQLLLTAFHRVCHARVLHLEGVVSTYLIGNQVRWRIPI